MTRPSSNPTRLTERHLPGYHGPENAGHELRIAYNCVIECNVTYADGRRSITGVNPDETIAIYKRAFNAFRGNDLLAAERWARSAKHLARAFWHEAKIAYLESHPTALPFLEGARPDEYNLHEHSDTSSDLINSVANHVPNGLDELPSDMRHYLDRARTHLAKLENHDYTHELLRAERIKAAHEYGRVLECMALAYEAEIAHGKAA
jgi:hypothetical protein